MTTAWTTQKPAGKVKKLLGGARWILHFSEKWKPDEKLSISFAFLQTFFNHFSPNNANGIAKAFPTTVCESRAGGFCGLGAEKNGKPKNTDFFAIPTLSHSFVGGGQCTQSVGKLDISRLSLSREFNFSSFPYFPLSVSPTMRALESAKTKYSSCCAKSVKFVEIFPLSVRLIFFDYSNVGLQPSRAWALHQAEQATVAEKHDMGRE